MDTLERIKVLINSSTPIILMETVEEERALALVRQAAADLELPVFEWSIADGLTRSPSHSSASAPRVKPPPPPPPRSDISQKIAAAKQAMYQAGIPQLDFLQPEKPAAASHSGPILNTKDAAGLLAHIGSMTIEAVFVLKDFHRQLDDATTVRLLRETAH